MFWQTSARRLLRVAKPGLMARHASRYPDLPQPAGSRPVNPNQSPNQPPKPSPRPPLVQPSPKPINENELGTFLAETIKAKGPLSLANFMRQCLTNPAGGYYINKDPFGKEGDFITSPEISQMFGELVGIWTLAQWIKQNRPPKIRLVELGPGRGTLMFDMLRTAQTFRPFFTAVSEIYLIEASPTLRKAQHAKLCGSTPLEHDPEKSLWTSVSNHGIPVTWCEEIRSLPNDSLSNFITAHEFFDALPILQFEKVADDANVSPLLLKDQKASWREMLVDYVVPKVVSQDSPVLLPNTTVIKATSSHSSADAKPVFQLIRSKEPTVSSRIVPKTHPRYDALPIGSKIEICPEAWDITEQLASYIVPTKQHTTRGGSLLFVDYGPADTIPVSTLRGIKNHHLVNPFDAPGEADLSADVDFGALKAAAIESQPGVAVYGPVEQGDWLHEMGIGARATVLAKAQRSEEGVKRIEQAYNRLTEKSGGAMGRLYKVMCVVPKTSPTPVGFGGDV